LLSEAFSVRNRRYRLEERPSVEGESDADCVAAGAAAEPALARLFAAFGLSAVALALLSAG